MKITDLKIEVKQRDVFGRQVFDGMNELAKAFLALMRQKTFTLDQLKELKTKGFTVELKAETLELE